MTDEKVHNIHVQSKSKVFQCCPDTSLLVGMGRVGVKYIPVGCRAGGCGVCKIHVLKGDYEVKAMSRAHVSLNEEDLGYALACRVFPRSDLVVEPYSTETLI